MSEDEEYQRWVESMVKHCSCTGNNSCPCDGVLAGGPCDQRHEEPDFTADDLEWSEEEA